MTNVGITGHQFRNGVDWEWVRHSIRDILQSFQKNDVLWTCLATGADTIAAEEALTAGLRLNVIIPHKDYDQAFSDRDKETFFRLVGEASQTFKMKEALDLEQAYLNAGLEVADKSDLLIVVWDGKPAAGKGGTGDIAKYAKGKGSSVVWCDTSRSTIGDLSSANV